MSEKMHEIDGLGGRKVSDSTIVEALQKHYGFEEKPYVFQAGDVAISRDFDSALRVICRDKKGEIMSIDLNGYVQSTSQESFELCHYKKIGVLRDFIKK